MERFIPKSVCYCAIVALLLVGCSSKPSTGKQEEPSALEQMAVAVAESVEDPQRSAQVRTLASQVSEAVREHFVEVEAARGRWFKLFSDYDSQDEDFEAIHDELRQRRQQLLARVVDLSLQIRDVMTPEEWAGAHDRLATMLSKE